ncbi:hypothetical protein J6590_044037, partial [Homalodisca vitripennis]
QERSLLRDEGQGKLPSLDSPASEHLSTVPSCLCGTEIKTVSFFALPRYNSKFQSIHIPTKRLNKPIVQVRQSCMTEYGDDKDTQIDDNGVRPCVGGLLLLSRVWEPRPGAVASSRLTVTLLGSHSSQLQLAASLFIGAQDLQFSEH